jgi:hypothetical protein
MFFFSWGMVLDSTDLSERRFEKTTRLNGYVMQFLIS